MSPKPSGGRVFLGVPQLQCRQDGYQHQHCHPVVVLEGGKWDENRSTADTSRHRLATLRVQRSPTRSIMILTSLLGMSRSPLLPAKSSPSPICGVIISWDWERVTRPRTACVPQAETSQYKGMPTHQYHIHASKMYTCRTGAMVRGVVYIVGGSEQGALYCQIHMQVLLVQLGNQHHQQSMHGGGTLILDRYSNRHRDCIILIQITRLSVQLSVLFDSAL